MNVPDWLPPAQIVRVEGRGEVFARVHRHPDPDAPVLLLLHGWTASADTQWLCTYEALAEQYSFVAVDHHGHGRGIRTPERFDLATAAADAAAATRALGFDRVVSVGYSMGGPISLHLWRADPQLLSGMVLCATALEWRDRLRERVRWRVGRVFRPMMRSWWYPRMIRTAMRRLGRENPSLSQYVDWLAAEMLRNDTFAVGQAGTALSKYDARSWVGTISVPTAMVITTEDRLVKPRKQRALSDALGSAVVEVAADHFCTLATPAPFNEALLQALEKVR